MSNQRDAMVNKLRQLGYAGVLLLCCTSCSTHDVNPLNPMPQTQTMQYAKGTFDVKVTPQEDKTGDAAFGHLLLEKQLQGDLVGTSRGQMLGANTGVEGSAGYVAVERITGVLHGRSGSFILQHVGLMGRGQTQLDIKVLPDSGTEQLQGLTGTMRIRIEQGQHYYELEYALPE
jgi:hypothetical protein